MAKPMALVPGSSPGRQDTRPHGPELAYQLRKVETCQMTQGSMRRSRRSRAGTKRLPFASVFLASLVLGLARLHVLDDGPDRLATVVAQREIRHRLRGGQ